MEQYKYYSVECTGSFGSAPALMSAGLEGAVTITRTGNGNVIQYATNKTFKKLKSKKTYYMRVRAYKVIDGKKVYTNFSSRKYVKMK